MKKTILFLIYLLAFPAFGAMDAYNIDPAHSQVGFQIRHLFSKVPGRFMKYSGKLDYDEARPDLSKIAVEIDTASISTDNEKRDAHLKSPDFFDAQKFPKITFKSTSVKLKWKNHLAVAGDLTIRDQTKPVTLEVEVLGLGPDPWGSVRGGFTGSTKINRKDFGVAWNQVLEGGGMMLGDEVEINLNVEVVKDKPPTPPAK